jgi:hypothetical protein
MARTTAAPEVVALLDAVRVADAALKADTTRADLMAARDRAVAAAADGGVQKQAIASVLGLSRQRVGQIVDQVNDTSA